MSLGVVPDIVTVHSVSILFYQHIPTNTYTKGSHSQQLSIAVSQLCNLRVGAYLGSQNNGLSRQRAADTAQLCGRQVTSLPQIAITFRSFRPVQNYTAWWHGHIV